MAGSDYGHPEIAGTPVPEAMGNLPRAVMGANAIRVGQYDSSPQLYEDDGPIIDTLINLMSYAHVQGFDFQLALYWAQFYFSGELEKASTLTAELVNSGLAARATENLELQASEWHEAGSRSKDESGATRGSKPPRSSNGAFVGGEGEQTNPSEKIQELKKRLDEKLTTKVPRILREKYPALDLPDESLSTDACWALSRVLDADPAFAPQSPPSDLGSLIRGYIEALNENEELVRAAFPDSPDAFNAAIDLCKQHTEAMWMGVAS